MVETPSDATLLDRFVSAREEAAFAALVRRHGPRVERICRRILRDEHDVEDVRQATFLILARKAAGMDWHESVKPWIDGVARRLAMHARSGTARRRARETTVTTLLGEQGPTDVRLPECYHPVVEPSAEVERRDLRIAIDDALQQLPEKYRAPVVLCDLEGQTREEAARRLGWPSGSMSRRLDKARSMLRHRLTGRGVAMGIFFLLSMAVAIRLGVGRSDPATKVRTIMSAFRDETGNGPGYGAILASAARGEVSATHLDRIRPAARAAAEAGRRIEGAHPGESGALWDRFAIEMTEAATDLERACDRSSTPALLDAARRLDASCVRCHDAFRKGPVPGVRRVSWRHRRSDPAPPRRAARPVARTERPWTLAREVRLGPPTSNECMDLVVWRAGIDHRRSLRIRTLASRIAGSGPIDDRRPGGRAGPFDAPA